MVRFPAHRRRMAMILNSVFVLSNLVVELIEHAIDRREVDLDRLKYVRNRTPGLSEALAGLLPYVVQRDDVALPTGQKRGPGGRRNRRRRTRIG